MTALAQPRCPRKGLFQSPCGPEATVLERFVAKCEFDPTTGCVMWVGGTTSGRGHSAPYGSFWDGKRWFAHRWAAKHIHGLEIDGMQVDHCCPHTGGRPNTLCVEHLQAATFWEHVELEQRRNNIHIQAGLLEPEPLFERNPYAPRIFEPPRWLLDLRAAYPPPVTVSRRVMPTIATIQTKVCAAFKVHPRAMTSNGRWPDYARPRQVAMYLSRELTRHSYSQIGRRFGGRDHSTILYGHRRIQALRREDKGLDEAIAGLLAELAA